MTDPASGVLALHETSSGAVVAGAFVDGCRRLGRVPDPDLRLLSYATAPADSHRVDDPWALGALHERLAGNPERRRRGAWYTPRWLAERLVIDAVRDVGVVVDPACGGGAFLLAAADRLVALGAAPDEVVGSMLWGADIDPLAVAVAEAALWWWSSDAGAPAVAGDGLVAGDALLDLVVPAARAVVGNPPFLGQLKASTAIEADRRDALRRRWGSLVRPYTDAAWLFLALAADAVGPGGRIAMIQPQSVLGARDAAAVRGRIDEGFVVESCWIDDGTAFAAAVDVCAPVLYRSSGSGDSPNDWTRALAEARGVPAVPRRWVDAPAGGATWPVLADHAEVFAGFRDEYYGLADAVHEAGATDGSPELVTVGAIDPLRRRSTPVRYAKQRWARPVLDIDAVGAGRATRWVDVQRAPKLLVATQTRIVEAIVDVDGSLIGSVPAIAVVPTEPDRLWHLAAALHAPVISAWMLRRTAGTALAADACKPTSAVLHELPLPTETDAWDRAAELAEAVAVGAERWDEFAAAADAAYGVDDPAITSWWLQRLPIR